MDKKYETEEERQDRYRKEVLDELNNSDEHKEFGKNVQSFGPSKKRAKVNFSKRQDIEISEIEEDAEEVKLEGNTSKSSRSSKVILFIGALVIIVTIFFFPTISKKISDFVNSQKRPSIDVEPPKEKVYEKLTLESKEIDNLEYPIMHSDISKKDSYYKKDKITVSDFSNNDILYNALATSYEGSMTTYTGSYSGKYCGNSSDKLSISDRYLRLRVDSLFTENAKYTASDFTIPFNNNSTKYVGTWKYDSKTSEFVYYGDCNNANEVNIVYYDIRVPYEANSSDKNIELYVYNYVVFAMVNKSNNSYTLYKDSDYSEEITKGTLTTSDYEKELTSIVNNYNKDSLNKYKYTFSIADCPYQAYCFISGEWIK